MVNISPVGSVPSSTSRVPEDQVSTWCEKEVKEEPCATVEKTGCRRTLPRRKFRLSEDDGRKKDRCDMTLGLSITDSKLPGSVIVGGEGRSSSGASSSTGSDAVESAQLRFWDRFRFLLKRRCSNSGVRGSKRYGNEDVTIRANSL